MYIGVKLCEYYDHLSQNGYKQLDKLSGVVEFIKEDFDQFYQLPSYVHVYRTNHLCKIISNLKISHICT